ncbi:DJ-1/PfpI family protein [Paraburkholderia phenoliruptrix]|uniref:DJ-1/PfpI family protein n=1 Tax=Paraburkholderia phenoliruptrix TaxID=252970 RepID=UPI00286988C4|nr:DJ-1/PfpI family protein [Paraburkholderia phenoliruptrix]WMY10919.1 DJ-1/PfpI family protein [Paraburkholderia phenoliruptrix]
MRRIALFWLVLLLGVIPFGVVTLASASSAKMTNAEPDRLPPYQPRFGRTRPVVAIVGENYYTELTDYVVPYGILMASGAADVIPLSTKPGPIRMFPAPMNVEPKETTAQFDHRVPEGADYVIVPAVHRDRDPTLVSWVAEQAKKGATIVGVCDGVWVVARAGLLDGRRATGHWYSMGDLRTNFPRTNWVEGKRYVSAGKVVTTTGVTATIPVSFALVEAIAGRDRANELAESLGRQSWSSEIPSAKFHLGWSSMMTIAGNYLSFWSHEDFGIPVTPGVDEIALVLQADVYSTTFRSTAYTVAQSLDPIQTKRGLMIVPDRVARIDAPSRMLPPPDSTQPLRALDESLKAIADEFGKRTAAWVALQMQYPGD